MRRKIWWAKYIMREYHLNKHKNKTKKSQRLRCNRQLIALHPDSGKPGIAAVTEANYSFKLFDTYECE
jgi:hypothetical protein